MERARIEAEDLRVELAARSDALLERIDLVDRLHDERRHLELDLAVKDDYISVLRAEVISRRNDYETLRFEFDELLRSRHYRAAVFLHRIVKKIPLVHRAVKGTVKLARSVRRRGTQQPE